MAAALQDARDFIYICGWAMHPDTRLTRPGATEGVQIGALAQLSERLAFAVPARVSMRVGMHDAERRLHTPAAIARWCWAGCGS